MVWNIVAVLATAYGGLLIGVFLFQSRLVYFPQIGQELTVTPRDAGLEFEEVWLTTDDGVALHGWFVPARQPRSTVLLLHGNAGNISHRMEYLLMFYRLGYSTFIFDYRGYGKSGGSPSEEGTYRDAQAAWKYLTGIREADPRRIVLLGESLGGAVAAWLASRHKPGALVLASTFTSVPDMGAEVYPFLPVRLLSRYGYNAREYLRSVNSPVLVAHSRDDDIVPYRHGQALFAAAREPAFLEMPAATTTGSFSCGSVDRSAALFPRQAHGRRAGKYARAAQYSTSGDEIEISLPFV